MQDPELINQLKERLPEALFEKLNGSLSIDRDRLRFAEYKVRVLEERLRLVRIEKYGPRKGRRNAILGVGIASFLACGSRSTSSSLC
jgi:hypothetical protein